MLNASGKITVRPNIFNMATTIYHLIFLLLPNNLFLQFEWQKLPDESPSQQFYLVETKAAVKTSDDQRKECCFSGRPFFLWNSVYINSGLRPHLLRKGP